jgi:hypothetical protein
MATYWFFALMSAICLEGLGRKYVPAIPSIAFYLLKDIVFLVAFLAFRRDASLRKVSEWLFRGFGVIWLGGFVWTVIEIANPSQGSFALGLFGLRAYWLWWAAPLMIASTLLAPKNRRNAIYVMAYFAIGISVLAALQFVSPPDSAINLYSVVDGEAVHASDAGIVYSTGRARVSGTFSYISGFSDFTLLVPTLLLSFGIDTSDAKLRRIAFIATGCVAAVLPMSGSRSSLVLGIGVLVLSCWAAGLLFTRVGRRIVIAGAVAAVLSVVAFPEAILGVQSRFDDVEETQARFVGAATLLPPVALAVFEYPIGGVGTGMAQNAAATLRITNPYPAEAELHRYLVELGVVGFLLMWSLRLGLVVALLRAYKILKQAERRGGAGAALSYAALTFFGNLTFDHIWQALYFVGVSFILAETRTALEILRTAAQKKADAVGPPPIAVSGS